MRFIQVTLAFQLLLYLTSCSRIFKGNLELGDEKLQGRNTARIERSLGTNRADTYYKNNNHQKQKYTSSRTNGRYYNKNNEIQILQYFTQTFAGPKSSKLMDAKQIKVFRNLIKSFNIDYGLNGRSVKVDCGFVSKKQEIKIISTVKGMEKTSLIKVVYELKWTFYSNDKLSTDDAYLQGFTEAVTYTYLNFLNIKDNKKRICAKLDELGVIECSKASICQIFTTNPRTSAPTISPTMEPTTIKPTLSPTAVPTLMHTTRPLVVVAPTAKSWQPTTTWYPTATWHPTKSWGPTMTWKPTGTWDPTRTWEPTQPDEDKSV